MHKALSQLEGDIVILGGYRGSILRSAQPPHRQLWAPVKVGLNIRKVDLEVGLDPEDDERVFAVHAQANANIKKKLSAAGLGPLPFMYLSDISKAQIPELYPAYGAENLARMKAIRDKYDPERVFTDLVPGGAKVAFS